MAISAEEELGEEESLDIVVFSLNPLPFSTASLSLFIKKLLEHPPWLDLYPSSDTSELLSHKNASLPLADIEALEDVLTVWSQLDFEVRGVPVFAASPLCIVGITLLEDFCSCWFLESLLFNLRVPVVFERISHGGDAHSGSFGISLVLKINIQEKPAKW